MATQDDLDRIMGDLPEVVEGEHHGRPTWSVRGRAIAWLRPFSKADLRRFGDRTPPGGPILAVTTADLHEKEGVLAAGLGGVFTIPHFDSYPAVLVELEAVDQDDLRDLLVGAWSALAPDDLVDDLTGPDRRDRSAGPDPWGPRSSGTASGPPSR